MEDNLSLRTGDLDGQSRPRRRLTWGWLVLGALGLLLLGWLNNTPSGVLGKADAVGYAVCHQIDARSFHIEGRALPLCARCSGMYLGFITGLVFLGLTRRRSGGMPSLKILLILGVLGLAFAVDGLNSYLHFFPDAPGLYEPNNTLRLLTGTGVGIAIAAVLYPAFIQTTLRSWQPDPVIGSFSQLGLLALLALGVDLLVLTENSLILYPLALISAGSVLVLLTLVYSMVLMMLFRLEGRIQHWSQLLLPLAGGLFLGILQIAIIDLGRFMLTGTWDGFNLG